MRGVSFEGTNTERSVARRGHRSRWRRNGGRRQSRGLVAGNILQKSRGRHEEKASAYGAAEIQQPIVVAGRPADEHVLQHLLDRSRRTCIANEIGAELPLRRGAEGHVVAKDLYFLAVLNDRCEYIVGACRLNRIVELDI